MNPTSEQVAHVLAGIGREDRARLLAALARRFGDIGLAEDVLQESLAAALETWPGTGVPRSPLAWLMTTARRKAIDVVRRDQVLAQKLARLRIETETSAPAAESVALASDGVGDERLAMLLGCCHPALREDERIALTLRFVAGLPTPEVARAFLVPVATMQQRIVRAKAKIRATGIPFAVPPEDELADRLPVVLRVVYLVYTEGYSRSSGPHHVRADLTSEAVHLARVLHRLLPTTAEVAGLLALLLLTDARRAARTDADGVPVPLPRQDRSRWDRTLAAEGLRLAEQAAGSRGAGTYTLQAAVAAVHTEAPSHADTDWTQILALYDLLLRLEPGPVVALNRAIAAGKALGPAEGLRLLDELSASAALARHRPYHVARAITLTELGRAEDARAAYARALDLEGNAAEETFIEHEMGRLPG